MGLIKEKRQLAQKALPIMSYPRTLSHLIGAWFSISRLNLAASYGIPTFQVLRVMGEVERPLANAINDRASCLSFFHLHLHLHLHHPNISHSFLVKEVCTSTFYHWVLFESTD